MEGYIAMARKPRGSVFYLSGFALAEAMTKEPNGTMFPIGGVSWFFCKDNMSNWYAA